ncbi:DUF411 domain-containing protein [Alphaproteobacteria bacterium]|nr:DUF411 domain-containing protein [Alphaproteobacteria bacterium]
MIRREFLTGTLAFSTFSTSVFAYADALMVNRTESCGCCGAWVERMNSAGFRAEVNFVNDEELGSIKSQLGIPAELSSCHTATIGSYFIEGHVPAEDIRRLLMDRPKALGLSVPGMPIGSPGMEMGSNKEPFETLLVFENGETQVFNSHTSKTSA